LRHLHLLLHHRQLLLLQLVELGGMAPSMAGFGGFPGSQMGAPGGGSPVLQPQHSGDIAIGLKPPPNCAICICCCTIASCCFCNSSSCF
jgi:hypothetical protein